MDVFGNYVVQKLFEVCDQAQKVEIAGKMEGNVFKLSMEMYGCRVGLSFPVPMFLPLLLSLFFILLLLFHYPFVEDREKLGGCSQSAKGVQITARLICGSMSLNLLVFHFPLFPLVTLVSPRLPSSLSFRLRLSGNDELISGGPKGFRACIEGSEGSTRRRTQWPSHRLRQR
jgi:hypothetical protein